MRYYDVAVVGAGFSGLSASKLLGEAGARTLVIEQNPAIGIPVRTSGGTWLNEMLGLGVPKEFMSEVEELKFFLNDEELGSYRAVNDKGAVLEVRRYLQWAAEELPHPPVDILLKTRLFDISLDREGLYLKTDKGPVRARFLIDCSGSWAFAARRFGLIGEWKRYAIGVEYEIFVGRELSTSALLMGSSYFKSGYAWLFPTGKRVRIGVGLIRPFSEDNPLDVIDKVMAAFRRLLLRDVPTFNPIELHAGIYPCQGILEKLVFYDRILLAGDAGSLGSPLLGEGIRYAIITGRKSAEAVLKAMSKNDPTILSEYERWVYDSFGRDFELAQRVQTLAATSSDKEIRRYVELFNALYQRNPPMAEEFFKTRLVKVLGYLGKSVGLSHALERGPE